MRWIAARSASPLVYIGTSRLPRPGRALSVAHLDNILGRGTANHPHAQ